MSGSYAPTAEVNVQTKEREKSSVMGINIHPIPIPIRRHYHYQGLPITPSHNNLVISMDLWWAFRRTSRACRSGF